MLNIIAKITISQKYEKLQFLAIFYNYIKFRSGRLMMRVKILSTFKILVTNIFYFICGLVLSSAEIFNHRKYFTII